MPVLTLPFLYEMDVKKPRGRSSVDTYLVREDVPFEIRELTDADVPVMTRWVHLDHHASLSEEDRCRFWPAGPYTSLRRVHGGRAYALLGDTEALDVERFVQRVCEELPLFGSGRRGHLPALPVVLDRAVYDGHGERHDPRAYPFRQDLLEGIAVDAKVKGVTVLAERRDEGLAQAVETYRKGILVVDGVVWLAKPWGEPVYEVIHAPRAHDEVKVQVSMGGSDPLDYVHRFAADRWDDALAYAERLVVEARAAGREVALQACTDRIEVFRPDLLLRDDGVMLAGQALVGARDCFDDDPETKAELDGLRSGLSRDIAWAGRVMSVLDRAFEARGIDTSLPSKGVPEAYRRWVNVERDRRHDMRADHDGGLFAGFGR